VLAIKHNDEVTARYAPWRTDDVLRLALEALRTRNRMVLPVLADALEEAGCDDAGALAVFRMASGNTMWTGTVHQMLCNVLGGEYARAASRIADAAFNSGTQFRLVIEVMDRDEEGPDRARAWDVLRRDYHTVTGNKPQEGN
jgi:hypothetical protein